MLRPAITWLYGFVDTQLTMAEGANAAAILDEHKHALADMCKHVNGVLQASGDSGLAACLWRATVALLTHFTVRTEPLLGQLRQHEYDAAAQRVVSAKLEAEIAALEKQLAEVRHSSVSFTRGHRRGSVMARRQSMARRDSSARGVLMNAAAMDAYTPEEADGEEDAYDDDEADEAEREFLELHERLVGVTSDLVAERNRNQSLQREVDKLRERRNSGAGLKSAQARAEAARVANASDEDGEDDDEDDARSATSDLPDAPTAEAAVYAKAARERAHEKKVETLQAELKAAHASREDEARKARRLELLRDEFARRFSSTFVAQIEKSLPQEAVAPDSSAAGTAIAAGLVHRQTAGVSRRQSLQISVDNRALSRRQSSASSQLGSPSAGTYVGSSGFRSLSGSFSNRNSSRHSSFKKREDQIGEWGEDE